jgi:hypothetical protein
MTKLEAVAVVRAPREAVFEFLSELDNHWRVADRFVDVIRLDGPGDGAADGGLVQLRGPLGLRRTVLTRVERMEAPALIVGTADIGTRTRAHVYWSLSPSDTLSRSPRDAGTVVSLAAEVHSASPLDRLLLALGGRAWLERRLASTLAHLARHFGVREPVAGPGGPALVGGSA